MRTDLERGVAEAPEGCDLLTMLLQAFRTAIPQLERKRSFAEARNEVIAATPALHERALTKEASLTHALGNALQRRGVPDRQAALAAQMGMAAFTQATLSWLDHPDVHLEEHLTRALEDVRALAAAK